MHYPALYPVNFESALVRVTLESGLAGWGEAQAPLAPEVACTIVEKLLCPALVGEEFDGARETIERLWMRMYSTMRVRGQTGGFMLDAISGVDLALWDLAGKLAGLPVSRLLAGEKAKCSVPAYLSGLAGHNPEERFQYARGFRKIKLYYEGDWESLLGTIDELREGLGEATEVAVDALWHLDPERAVEMAAGLDARDAMWLECPFPPEDPGAHAALARSIRTPLALGESYRTCHELAPFFRERAMGYVQPDLGRAGITEGLRIARMAAEHGVPVVPHVSIALGPQIAAAIHFSAAAGNCGLCEYNPRILEVANRYLEEPVRMEAESYAVPERPGLGVTLRGVPGVFQCGQDETTMVTW
jgi:galactonate dehydratase